MIITPERNTLNVKADEKNRTARAMANSWLIHQFRAVTRHEWIRMYHFFKRGRYGDQS